MNLPEILGSRDLPIEDRVLQVIWGVFEERRVPLSDEDKQSIEQRIERAFQEGKREWAQTELPAIIGRNSAREVLRRLEETVV